MGGRGPEWVRAPIEMKLVATVCLGLCDIDEHPPSIVLPPQARVERPDVFEENLVKTPTKWKRLAAVQLDGAILGCLRQHVQRAVPAEYERIRQVVGPFESGFRHARVGILENLDRHYTPLLRVIRELLEEEGVSALVLDGDRICPKAVFGRHQIA